MFRTSFVFATLLAFSTTAFAAPAYHGPLKTRAASLSQRHMKVKPFTEAEKLMFERASVFTGVGGDGGGGSGGGGAF